VIVGRWACSGTDDLPRVRALQATATLTPLVDAAAAGLPEPDPRVPERLAFWEKLRVGMAAFPPAQRYTGLRETFRPLGLLDTTSPYLDPDSDRATSLIAAAERAERTLKESLRSMPSTTQNGWQVVVHMVDYNADFFEVGTLDGPEWRIEDQDMAIANRASVAIAGLWGNHGYEATYALTYVDGDGRQLTGDHTYTLTLDPPPPADAFWSLTMYDMPHYYLVDNPIDRYSVGDRTPGLVTGANGSVTITISADEPDDEAARANWLPAPHGPFRPCLRIYNPRAEVTDGTYVVPPIINTDPS
jgi:hypothetical protein